MIYNVGSLFAGVGGICLGFKLAKTDDSHFNLNWANEIDEFACETYRKNFNHTLFQGDIEKILHPTRIHCQIELLRNMIKSIEELKDEKQIKINKIFDSMSDEDFSDANSELKQQIEDLQQDINNLKNKSTESENELNNILQIRDNEFSLYLQNNILPTWITEQNKLEEFNYYLALRNQLVANPIDVLNGGFPCQAFSIAGDQHGFKDPRGNLFLSIVDLIELLGDTHTKKDDNGKILINGKPRILFLENVKNLKNHDNGRTYKHIKKCLENCGYTIFEKVLNTMNYSDLPQNRERIYIIGFRDKVDADQFTLFNKEIIDALAVTKTPDDRHQDVQNVIDYSEAINIESSPRYYYTPKKYPNYFSDKKNGVNLYKQITEMYQFYQCRRGQYVRKNQSDVCPTLTANMGTGGHNVPLIKVHDGIRKITPAEAFKLQGFPVGNGYSLPTTYNGRTYSDSHLYKQAGNAVSVPMIQMLAQEILSILETSDKNNA